MRSLVICALFCALSFAQNDPAQLLRAGQFQNALDAIHVLLQTHPDDARLLSMQGIAQAQLGDESAALASYRRALTSSPDYLAALEGAAQIEYKHNDKLALTHLNRLLALNSRDATAHAMRAILEAHSENCPAAIDDFVAAFSAIQSSPDALHAYAGCLFHLGRWSESEKIFAGLLASHPADRQAAYGAAASQIEAGEFENALATLAPFDNDPVALSLRAQALEKLARIPEAVTTLRSAIVADPKRESLYTQFAQVCFTYRSYQAGIDVINAGLTQLPNSPKLYLSRGILYVQQGNYDLADRDFAKAEALNPAESTGSDAAILALVQANKLDEAQVALTQKLKIHPKDPDLLYLLADILNRKSEPDAAFSAVKQSLALRPDFVLAHDLLARLYWDRGNLPASLAECQAALKTDPDDEAALYRWLRILKSQNKDSNTSSIAEVTARWTRARQKAKDDEFRQSQFRILTDPSK